MNGSGTDEPRLKLKNCMQSAARLAVAAIFLQWSSSGICQSMEFDTGPFNANLYDAAATNVQPANLPTGSPTGAATNFSKNFALRSTEYSSELLAQSSQQVNQTSGVIGTTGAGAAPSASDSDRSTSGKNSVRTLLDDSMLTAKVKAAMIADASVKNNQISVETDSGEVTLSGAVATAQEITQAEKIAGNIVGVKSVVNKLKLKK